MESKWRVKFGRLVHQHQRTTNLTTTTQSVNGGSDLYDASLTNNNEYTADTSAAEGVGSFLCKKT